MKNLVVKENQEIKLYGYIINEYNNITINSGGIITIEADYDQSKWYHYLLIYIKNNLIIKSGGSIDVSFCGHLGGMPRTSGVGCGAGISYMNNNEGKL